MRSAKNRYTAQLFCAGLLVLALVPVALGATNPVLKRVVLRGPQIAAGYKLVERPDGHGVARFVTLSMCGFAFPSEKLRTDRLQVDYVRAGTPVTLSNEVVIYRAGGAAQAMREVTGAVAQCPPGPVETGIQGLGPLTYKLTRLRSAGLLPGYEAFRAHVKGKSQGKPFEDTAIIIYQRRGNVLSAVYGYRGKLASRTKTAFVAAKASAKNLTG
jgi:hypothetical protein